MAKGQQVARAKTVDHRTRVGKERKARTRVRIIRAALGVFANAGEKQPVIDDFIRAAEVARGTFYNYYKDVLDLLEDTTKYLDNDLVQSIEAEISESESAAERLTFGIRLWIRKAADDPAWCLFMAKARTVGQGIHDSLGRDLRNGLRAGVFEYPTFDAAFDLVVGTVREAMNRLTIQRVGRDYDAKIARVILRGLGVERRAIDALLKLEVPELRQPPLTVA
jgi:AcrR family transcriptional regulator